MRTIKKISLLIILFTELVMFPNKVYAQCYPINFPIGIPIHAEVQSPTGILAIMTGAGGGGGNCLIGGTALTFFGISNSNPQYITDILGNAIGDGVNVSGPGASLLFPNAVGYSIGGAVPAKLHFVGK